MIKLADPKITKVSHFPCPHCQKSLRHNSSLSGRSVQCPKCKKSFRMPLALSQTIVSKDTFVPTIIVDTAPPATRQSRSMQTRRRNSLLRKPLLLIIGIVTIPAVTVTLYATLSNGNGNIKSAIQQALGTPKFNPTDLEETISWATHTSQSLSQHHNNTLLLNKKSSELSQQYSGQQVTWRVPVRGVNQQEVKLYYLWKDTSEPYTTRAQVYFLTKDWDNLPTESMHKIPRPSREDTHWIHSETDELKIGQQISLAQAEKASRFVTIQGTVNWIEINGPCIGIQLKSVRAL